MVDCAEDGLAVFQKTNQGAKKRNASDEGFCAVDGIEDPYQFSVATLVSKFFADDTVIRMAFADFLAQDTFSFAVGEGDRSGIILGFDLEPRVYVVG